MKLIKSPEGEDSRLFRFLRFLLRVFYIVLLARAVLLLANVIWLAIGGVSIADTGSAIRMDGIWGIGYGQFSYAAFPGQRPEDAKQFCTVYMTLLLLTRDLPQLLLLEYGRRILKAMGRSASPFLPLVASCIRAMGWVLLAMGLLAGLLLQLGLSLLVYGRVYLDNPTQLTPILMGCVLFLLADVFRRGCALQQQADETL